MTDERLKKSMTAQSSYTLYQIVQNTTSERVKEAAIAEIYRRNNWQQPN